MTISVKINNIEKDFKDFKLLKKYFKKIVETEPLKSFLILIKKENDVFYLSTLQSFFFLISNEPCLTPIRIKETK